jgi:hypothetical protein
MCACCMVIVVGDVLYQLWMTSCIAPCCWLLDHYLIGPAAGEFVCRVCVLRVVRLRFGMLCVLAAWSLLLVLCCTSCG